MQIEEVPFTFEPAILKYPQEIKGLVSIIIPIYNTERYLKEALDSVLAQTFENWEAILVNDGSTQDSIPQICAEYTKMDSRFRYVSKEENRGLLLARKTGLENARGEFIANLDSDDVWHPQFLEKMVAKIQKGGEAGYDYVVCQWRRLGDKEATACGGPHNIGEDTMETVCRFAKDIIWNKLIKRSIYANVVFPQIILVGGEDYIQMIQIIYHSKSTGFVPEALCNYRLDSSTSSTNTFSEISANRKNVASVIFAICIYITAKRLLGRPNAEELFAVTFGNSFARYFTFGKRDLRRYNIEYAARFVPAYSRGLKRATRKNMRWWACFLASKGFIAPFVILVKMSPKIRGTGWLGKRIYWKFAHR